MAASDPELAAAAQAAAAPATLERLVWRRDPAILAALAARSDYPGAPASLLATLTVPPARATSS